MPDDVARHAQQETHFADTDADKLSVAATRSIASLNQEYLRYLSIEGDLSKDREICGLLHHAPEAAAVLALECPFLLCDLRWRDPLAWRTAVGGLHRADDSSPSVPLTQSVALTQSVLVFAWYVVRRWPTHLGLFIGASREVGAVIEALELPQLHRIAVQHHDWLVPRWSAHPTHWQQLLEMAMTISPPSTALRIRTMELFLGGLLANP